MLDFEHYAAPKREGLSKVPRWGVVLLIFGMAAGETMLAYLGLKLAVPRVDATKGDVLLSAIARYGALAASIAVGAGSAVAQLAVGREIARSARGVFENPDSNHPASRR